MLCMIPSFDATKVQRLFDLQAKEPEKDVPHQHEAHPMLRVVERLKTHLHATLADSHHDHVLSA